MRLLPDSLFDKDNEEYDQWKKFKQVHKFLKKDWSRAIEAYEAAKGSGRWPHKSVSLDSVIRYFTVSHNYYS